MNNIDSEISRLEAFAAKNPADPHIINRIGYLYYQKGDTGKAIECCKDSMLLFLKNGQTEQAVTLFKEAALGGFFDFRATAELADYLYKKGRNQDAIDVCLTLAKKNLGTNEWEAEKFFEKIIEFDPRNKIALAYLRNTGGDRRDQQSRPRAEAERLHQETEQELMEEAAKLRAEIAEREETLEKAREAHTKQEEELNERLA
ncbi:MAG: hypothetical protein JSV13_08470, partial [Nitrospiraceae bacterium]